MREGGNLFPLEFPQNLIGYAAFKFLTRTKQCPYYRYRDAAVVHVTGSWGALTLSKYIFADDNYYQSDVIQHEYGHRIQSRLLLILYLPIIALPSLIWASFFEKYRQRHHTSYYWFYTEAWANKLSGSKLQ